MALPYNDANILRTWIQGQAKVVFPGTETEVVVYNYNGGVFACLVEVSGSADEAPTVLAGHAEGTYRTTVETQALQYLWKGMKDKAGVAIKGKAEE
ncbi:hypothetical protein K4F52_005479 [Lecanicillium sp. MT-2017a]|nr:hypothetical protein K4F52_005479 [Lecanicillium sp. MT-2017a]